MTSVRCIFVDTTVPTRIRPRMETNPVKGHFLSAEYPSQSTDGGVKANQSYCVPMYCPSTAYFGVRNPKPTSLYHRRPDLPARTVLAFLPLWLRKMCGCFW
jgi:hypothetical protein